MDRSWMKANRLNEEYGNIVVEFLQLAKRNISENNEICIILVIIFGNTKKHGKKINIESFMLWWNLSILYDVDVA